MNGCKYYKQEEQVSYDNKQTWESTGNYRKGDLYESHSYDCPEGQRWKQVPGGYICENGSKYQKLVLEITDDGGNYKIKYPASYSAGTLIEANSPECDYKWYGHYIHVIPQPVEIEPVYYDPIKVVLCSGSSDTLTTEDISYDTNYHVLSGYVGDCVTTIGQNAFSGQSRLEEIDLSDSVTQIYRGAFQSCTSLTSVTIPDSVTTISDNAFMYCRNLRKINIGSGATYIGDFTYCNQLVTCILNATTPPSGSPSNSTSSGCTFFVPDSSVNDYKASSAWSGKTISGISSYTGEKLIRIGDSGSTYDNTKIAAVTYCDSSSVLNKPSTSYSWQCTAAIIGDCVTELGWECFKDYVSLSAVTMPSGLTTIGYAAFQNCQGLSSLTIPDSVTTIGNNAFERCRFLECIRIPDSVTSIGYYAFSGCTSLENVTIGSGVTKIEFAAFRDCSDLTSVTIGSGVTSIGTSAFYSATSLTNIVIPDSVTSIGGGAFQYCRSLTSCTIGSGVTSIGDDAFYYCSSLTNITVNATTPPSLGFGVFTNTNSCPIYVNTCSLVDVYKAANGWSSYATRIVSNDCPSLNAEFDVTDITNPTRIISNVTSIRTIVIDESVALTPRTGYTFSTFDEHNVKYYLSGTTLGGAFYSATTLTSIEIPDIITNIGASAFTHCNKLVTCTLSSGITSIENNTFRWCTKLTGITIPNGVTTIGDSAFQSCTSLTGITIPDSVTSIGASAFTPCSAMTTCTIGSGVTSIGNYAFRYCSGLTSIVIPDSVTSIGQSAFVGCSSLTSCTIGSGVTSINNYAFEYCLALASVTIMAVTPPTLGSDVFYKGGNYSPPTIYVPSESVDVYKSASGWKVLTIRAIPT